MKELILVLFLFGSFSSFSQRGTYVLEKTVPKQFVDLEQNGLLVEIPIIIGDKTLKLGFFKRVKFIEIRSDNSTRIYKGWWTIKENIIHIDLGKTDDAEFDLEYIVLGNITYLKFIENSHLYLKKK